MSDKRNADRIGDTTKIERYKWKDASEPGELMWIDKQLLSVDHRYQRDGDNEKAQILAQRFSWQAFGTLIVARRPAGEFKIADGQHRWLASLKRADITKVPCIVFDSVDEGHEAGVFLEANAHRKPVSAVAKFKAAVLSGNQIALAIKALVDDAGREVTGSSNANAVNCVALLGRLLERCPDVLFKVWPVITSVCVGRPISERIVDALVYLESRMPEGQSLTDRRWRGRLVDIGVDELNRAMSMASAFYARGGAKVWAIGVVNRLNKGVAEAKRLSLDGAASP